jgi:hypothetical protein
MKRAIKRPNGGAESPPEGSVAVLVGGGLATPAVSPWNDWNGEGGSLGQNDSAGALGTTDRLGRHEVAIAVADETGLGLNVGAEEAGWLLPTDGEADEHGWTVKSP